MIGKILQATRGKLCTCSPDKSCVACRNKKTKQLRSRVINEEKIPRVVNEEKRPRVVDEDTTPRILIEESRPFGVPLKITAYRPKPSVTTVQFFQNRKFWGFRQKPTLLERKTRGFKLCRWYRRRKALKALIKINKQEQKRIADLRIERARLDREAEFLEELKQRQKELIPKRPPKRELKKLEAARIETARLEREAAEYEQLIKQRKKKCYLYKEPDLKTLRPKKREFKKLEAARIKNAYLEEEPAEYEQLKRKRKKKRYKEPKVAKQPREEEIEIITKPKMKKKKKKKEKRKGTIAKPAAESRYANVRTIKPPKEGCMNAFHRKCCECCCCLSVLLIIASCTLIHLN